MSKLNILYGGITATLAVIFLVSTVSFPSEQRGLDPRVYPRFISICFFALSVGLIVTGLKSDKGKTSNKEPIQEALGIPPDTQAESEDIQTERECTQTESRPEDRRELPGFSFEGFMDGLKETFLSPARKRIWGMFLVALGYVAIIDTVGYLVATPPFLVGSMVLFGERKGWRILLVSLVTTVVLFGLFRIIFRVPLPVSSLW